MSQSMHLESILAERERALLASLVCLRCGAVGETRRELPSSTAAEVLLWCLGALLVAIGDLGILALAAFHSVWRRGTGERGCASCHARHTLVPGRSPKGRAELVSQGLLGP